MPLQKKTTQVTINTERYLLPSGNYTSDFSEAKYLWLEAYIRKCTYDVSPTAMVWRNWSQLKEIMEATPDTVPEVPHDTD